MKNSISSLSYEAGAWPVAAGDHPAPGQLPGREGEHALPLLVTPGNYRAGLVQWMNEHREQFEADLTRHGGVLLRGWDVRTVEDFSAFMNCFNTEPLPYMFRSSPRKELSADLTNIYTSTIYPNERVINMHNETSYSRVWGKKIAFCCIVPPQEGGETPIADSRRVLKDISPALVEKFRTRGVKYRRNLFSYLGMPWQEVFQTNDMGKVKEICAGYNIQYAFTGDGQLVIEWTKPAVYRHPVSREETWFNHVMFFNKYARYEELGVSPEVSLPSEYLASDTFFGDGSEITHQEYTEIKNAYRKNTVSFPYQQGDILFLDNMLTAHGRNPYKGERVIATAIIEALYDAAN